LLQLRRHLQLLAKLHGKGLFHELGCALSRAIRVRPQEYAAYYW